MKSYSQYCGLARALDVIGDRWSMLIVREVAIRDCRYSDIRDGLPGIASNLLADRLKVLAAHGIIERYDAPPPVAAPLYRLADRGRELLPALHALIQWAVPMMLSGPTDDDEQRGRWAAFAAEAVLHEVPPGVAPLRICIEIRGEFVTIDIDAAGKVTSTHQPDPAADVRISGGLGPVMAYLSGEADPAKFGDALTITASRPARQRLTKLVRANHASRTAVR